MRDLALTAFVFGSVPFILWKPVIGVFVFVWLSVMNPHRLAWGFAYDMRFALVIALATLVGLFLTKHPKRLPVTPTTVVLFLFVLWMNITTFFALDFSESLSMWEKVMKIQAMVFVALMLLHTKQQVNILIWIVAGSVAFFAIKGGLFTLHIGGEYRVFGPAESFIQENNSLALATIMTIPLLRYLQMHTRNRLVRYGLVAAMVLSGFAALGSHSRGGFLAIGAMLAFLWLKSRHKSMTSLVIIMLVPVAIGFMPEKWSDRMKSIQEYEQDESALGRINSWKMAINLTADRPLLGGGYAIYTRPVFDRYAPESTVIRSAHSIYFQVLGEHGVVGFVLFLVLGALVWRDASLVIRDARDRSSVAW